MKLGAGAWQPASAPILVGDAAVTVAYSVTDAAGNTSGDNTIGLPAAGTTSVVPMRVSARAMRVGESAVVAVHAINAAADVRLTTAWGDKKYVKVAPGQAVYKQFPVHGAAAAAGTATIAGYTWVAGFASRTVHTVSFSPIDCG